MSEYAKRVESNLEGLKFVSVGISPSCKECASQHGFKSMRELKRAYESGYSDEGGFSWSGCGICDSTLGGDKFIWHAVGDDNKTLHFSDCCVDCLQYIANGTEPENDETAEPDPHDHLGCSGCIPDEESTK